MKFFNKKEEVIDLQLTQYGKRLLSKGKWKPSYYAFFDDNILYDTRYANLEEDRINARKRIQEETPQLKTQYINRGIDSDFKRRNDYLNNNIDQLENIIENPSPLDNPVAQSAPLGNSEIGNNKAPRWKTNVYLGQITEANMEVTGAFATSKIPQLHTRVEFVYDIRNQADNFLDPSSNYGRNLIEQSEPFFDNSFFRVFDDQLITTLYEKNVDFNHKNFDIEVFLIEEEEITGSAYTPGVASGKETIREVLIPLKFRKPHTNVENELLMDRTDYETEYIQEIDNTYVEYYFDLNVDDEIDLQLLCESNVIQRIKSEDLRRDLGVVCPEKDNVHITDRSIYSSKITQQDIEDCE